MLEKENQALRKENAELNKELMYLNAENKELRQELSSLITVQAVTARSINAKPNTKRKYKKAGRRNGHKGKDRRKPDHKWRLT